MFDSYHLHNRNVTEQVTKNVSVTEKRAPTDESVKILTEMEDAVRARFLKKQILNSNVFRAYLVFSEDLLTDNIIVDVAYQINAIFKDIQVVINKCYLEDHDYVTKTVTKAISKDLVSVIQMDGERIWHYFQPQSNSTGGSMYRVRESTYKLQYYGSLDPWDHKKQSMDDLKIVLIKQWLEMDTEGKIKDAIEDLL
jgi:hypothetical protein